MHTLHHTTADDRVQQLFSQELSELHRQTDRAFCVLLIGQWLFGIGCAVFLSPFTWRGDQAHVHMHVWTAILLGGLLASLPCWLAFRRPGAPQTRWVIAIAQSLFSGLFIHLMGGRIEAHFHVFGSLALLAFYRDPRVFIPAVAVVFFDHLLRGVYWPESIYGVLTPSILRTLEHTGWVVFETSFLIWGIQQGRSHLKKTSALQASLEQQRDRLEAYVAERTTEICRSRDYFAQVLDSMDAHICILQKDGTILSTNSSWLDFALTFGATEAMAVPGANYLELCRNAQGEFRTSGVMLADAIEDVIAGDRPAYVDEFPCHDLFGQRWFHVRVSPFSGDCEAAAVVAHTDITKRILASASAAEDQLRAQSLARIIEEAPSEIYLVDQQTLKFLMVSNGVCDALGYTREEMLTLTPMDLQKEKNEIQIRTQIERLMSGELKVLEFTLDHIKKSGATYPVHVSLHVAVHRQSRVLVAFVTNLTDLRQLQSQLSQAQKLESLGQLAAGVAHEINSPLQCISLNVEYLTETRMQLADMLSELCARVDADSAAWDELQELLRSEYDVARAQRDLKESTVALEEASEACSRVVEIVGAMQAMSHPGAATKVATDINQIISDSVTVTRHRWKQCAVVDLDLSEDLPSLLGYPAQLAQVFTNMLINAVDAIEESCSADDGAGRITIRTVRRNHAIVVSVVDNGAGIPVEKQERVFDLFYTTKEIGKGTGQGLAIAYDVVVTKHGGAIELDSAPGKGTRFTLTLPLADHAAPEDAQEARLVGFV